MTMTQEKGLALQLCRVSSTAAELAAVRALAEANLDWNVFQRHCNQEGVLPTVYQSLSKIVDADHPGLLAIRKPFLAQSLSAFEHALEFVRLLDHLEKAGIPALALKGLAVGQQIYGGLVGRPAGDLDLLVAEPSAWRALEVLRGLGYRQILPNPLSDHQEQALIVFGEGRQLKNCQRQIDADLHWRTLDRWVDVRLDFSELWTRREILAFPGGPLTTLGREDTALILCLHGCQHGFERWKWVLDVARAAHPEAGVCWEEVLRRAGHRRPMVDFALQLAHRLLGSPVPRACRPSAGVLSLVTRWEGRFRGEIPPAAPGLLDPVVAVNLNPALSRRGWLGLVWGLATFALPAKEDVESVSFPPRLFPLYYGVRWLHLARKFCSRLRDRLAARFGLGQANGPPISGR